MNKLWFLLPLVILAGCGASPSERPGESAELFMEAVFEKDWSGVCRLMDTPSRASLGEDCTKGAEQVWGKVGDIYTQSRPRVVGREGRFVAVATDAVPRILFLYREDRVWEITLFPPDSLEQGLG